MNNPTQTVLVICGPTASGKTSLALSIAKHLISSSSLRAKRGNPASCHSRPDRESITICSTVNILSVDSRQVYRDLDILTGKDIPENLPEGIKIYGLDIVDTDRSFNLADFVQYAQSIIRKSLDEKTPLIIVGGTGLYLKAITSNLLNVHVPPNQKIRREMETKDLASLQKISNRSNPSPSAISSAPHFLWIGLKPDKDTLKEYIRHRVLDRLNSGAIDEVKNLIKNYPDNNQSIFTCLGVREIKDYLNQKISREQLIDLWTNAEIDYARRQIVWFNKQPSIVWYDRSSIDNKLISKLAKVVYQNDKK
ncbi:MAG: tRNA dimethylallyltransferase [Candidatus Collierbacteria bacterium GW2011_GWB1_44_6]|uniref:tRNA dimethylallyltransferase n=1 Tax=Candidatus Collierbacteria bacterium GW2011_GWB1_44_6 TaxID=1618384 RepID=A0A0G1MNB4_9BACT|nr:MAG: tRNA dimethylallyltransferase [Candidatus Collierbacteria bacterium GW2011_GWB1_44_6]